MNTSKETNSSQLNLDIDFYALHNSFPDIECNTSVIANYLCEIEILTEMNEIRQRADAIINEETLKFASETINEIFPDENELAPKNDNLVNKSINSEETQSEVDPQIETLIQIGMKIIFKFLSF